jgi:SAM-dependent methyltransferase
MLEPVTRCRSAESFRSVLDWGCGLGLLEPHLAKLAPRAALTGLGTDGEALEWARAAGLPGEFGQLGDTPPAPPADASFDLVVGHGTLSHVRSGVRAAWLDELHRLTEPAGYLALTFLGELAARFMPDAPSTLTRAQAIAACGERFDVMSYVEGGVAGLHDLIVLRRP